MLHARAILPLAAAVLLAGGGSLLCARPAFNLARRAYSAAVSRSIWERWVRSREVPAGFGEPAGWMSVPSAGIDTLVLRGATKENLLRYPCLEEGFMALGSFGGLKLIAGHRDTHFRGLEGAAAGSLIIVSSGDGQVWEYTAVDSEILAPGKVPARLAEKSDEEWLVLMTCYPFRFFGPAPARYLLWAKPSGRWL